MKFPHLKSTKFVPLVLLLLIIPLSSCQVDKEEAAQLPDVLSTLILVNCLNTISMDLMSMLA